jgi:hypothetical protein
MITHDSIEEVPYKLYVTGGCVEGHDLDNWIEAEGIYWNGIENETQCTLEFRT